MASVKLNSNLYFVRPKDKYIEADASNGNIQITLFDAGLVEGAELTVTKTDSTSNTVTMLGKSLSVFESYISVKSVNGQWFVTDYNNSDANDNVVYIEQFGAVADADYYDATTELWYVDAAFTTEATDNRLAFQNALNTNKKVIVSEGNYMIKRDPSDRNMVEVTGSLCHLEGVGEVNIYIPAYEVSDGVFELRFIETDCTQSHFKNLYIESKNLYQPFIGGSGSAGLTSNIVGVYTTTASNVHFENVQSEGLLQTFEKTSDDNATTNYTFRNCQFENQAIGMFVNNHTGITLDNVKITTNNETDGSGDGLNDLCHCTYFGFDVKKVFFTNCDFEVKNKDTGDPIKFSFNTTTYSSAVIEDVVINNCVIKTLGTELSEMSAVSNLTMSNCVIEMTGVAGTEKFIVFTNKASTNVNINDCIISVNRFQRIYDTISFNENTFTTPVRMNNCTFTYNADGLNGGGSDCILDNKVWSEFKGCSFVNDSNPTSAMAIVRGTGGNNATDPLVELFDCKFEITTRQGWIFNVANANFNFRAYGCSFKALSDSLTDVFNTVDSNMRFQSYNNVYIGYTQYEATVITGYAGVNVNNDVFVATTV